MPPDPWALARYQAIAAYVALVPPRGGRRPLLEQLAARSWPGPDGEPFTASAETLRAWVRRYRTGGLDALSDAVPVPTGVQALTAEEVQLFCALKREVPARSLDRLIEIAEAMELIAPGKARRSTVHRALQAEDLSARRPSRAPPREDLDRFEAAFPNELWQSDMLEGPLLPDPTRRGGQRRAYLYTFLDDHSRMCLHGRFSFRGDLPALELVFRRSLQKYGKPARVYYDNGAVYRSRHMRHVVACLGIHGIVFTRAHRPMGHGKIEAFNRLVTSAFLAEVPAARITTLDALNEAWLAWADGVYNLRVHGETGEAPRHRWRRRLTDVRFCDEDTLRDAFLWTETRTPDKAGIFSLFGTEYQVGPALAKRKIELRYDPENLALVEAWHEGTLAERVGPFVVGRHRRPHPVADDRKAPRPEKPRPVANWLGHLTARRRAENFVEPTPQALADALAARRAETDATVFDVLAARVDPAVLDPAVIRAFLARFGPWDPARVGELTDSFFALHPRDTHVQVLLDHLHTQLKENRR
jgi:transposase InsO family protein